MTPKILLYPPPSFYGADTYAGGPAYLRSLAAAPWAEGVYVLPSPHDPAAPVRFARASAPAPCPPAPGGSGARARRPWLRFLPFGARLAAGYVREAAVLARYLKRFAAATDAVHINGVGCEVAAIAARLAGFRQVIGTVHNLPGNDREAHHWIRRVVERISFRSCDHLIFPSQYCLERWRFRVRVPPSHRVIYHGCRRDVLDSHCTREEAFRRLNLDFSLAAGRLVLGVAGRFDACKGHDLLFRAMAGIGAQLRMVLLLAGDGPLENALKAQAHETGIRDQVVFLGRCGRMEAFFRALDVNVLPSRSEGLGYSVVEAMHAGLPQVVSDAGGMAEIVRASEGGIVFPSEDTDALAAAILRMRDPAFRRECGQKSEAYARQWLTEERMHAETLAFYARCLGRGPAAAGRTTPGSTSRT